MKTKTFELDVGGKRLDLVVNFDYDHINHQVYVDDFWVQGDDLGLNTEEKEKLGQEINKILEQEQTRVRDYENKYQQDMAEYFELRDKVKTYH